MCLREHCKCQMEFISSRILTLYCKTNYRWCDTDRADLRGPKRRDYQSAGPRVRIMRLLVVSASWPDIQVQNILSAVCALRRKCRLLYDHGLDWRTHGNPSSWNVHRYGILLINNRSSRKRIFHSQRLFAELQNASKKLQLLLDDVFSWSKNDWLSLSQKPNWSIPLLLILVLKHSISL